MKTNTIILKVVLALVACNLHADDIYSLLWQRKTDEAKQLIQANPELIAHQNEHGFAPAHIAAWTGNNDMLAFLIERGADINLNDKYLRPVVTMALMGNHPDTLKFLLEKGASLDWVDEDNTTPLIYASYKDNPELIKIVLDKIDPATISQANNWGWTPLMSQCHHGWTKGAMILLKAGADPNSCDSDGNCPLIFAAKCGAFELIEPLIKAGADVNAVDKDTGKSAFHWAAAYGYESVCKALIKNGIDTTITDINSKTGKDYLVRYALPPKEKKGTKVADAGKQMGTSQAQIIYSGHSGWIVRTKNNILVFDYWKPNRAPDYPSLRNGWLTKADTAGLPVTIFTSHDHQDHYDVTALKGLAGVSDRVSYVYGFKLKMEKKEGACCEKAEAEAEKTKKKMKTDSEFTHFAAMKPRTHQTINGIEVTTINSIDTGVGFLVSVDGVSFFHAGDHANLSPEDEAAYFAEIDYLKDQDAKVDVAFLPVSGCPSRWKIESVKDGFVKTIEALKPKAVFPMHGMGRENSYKEFAALAADSGLTAEVLCAEFPGDTFSYAPQANKVALK